MVGQDGKLFIRAVIVVCVVAPVGLMFINPLWGAIAMILAMFTIYGLVHLTRLMSLEHSFDSDDALYAKTNSSGTIYVQLIDDNGVPLPVEQARAKLDAARQQAGPRDTVLGVHRKVG